MVDVEEGSTCRPKLQSDRSHAEIEMTCGILGDSESLAAAAAQGDPEHNPHHAQIIESTGNCCLDRGSWLELCVLERINPSGFMAWCQNWPRIPRLNVQYVALLNITFM